MRKSPVVFALSFAVLLSSGCAIREYARICDPTTGDKFMVTPTETCYIKPDWHYGIVWPNEPADICEFLITFIEQDVNGDQRLFTRCWWGYMPCEAPYFPDCAPAEFTMPPLYTSYNWCLDHNAETFDKDAPCARSLQFLIDVCDPAGECDSVLGGPCTYLGTGDSCPGNCLPCPDPSAADDSAASFDLKALLKEFGTLPKTTYLGKPAVEVPISSITLRSPDGTSGKIPLSGGIRIFVTGTLESVTVLVEISREARQEYRWLTEWIDRHGERVTATVSVGSFTGSVKIRFLPEAIRLALESLS